MAAAVGISLSEYERMTPFELSIYAEEYVKQRQREAYLNGLVIRHMVGTLITGKSPLSYDQMFGRQSTGKNEMEPMTDDAMFKQAMFLNKLFGGKIVWKEATDNGSG